MSILYTPWTQQPQQPVGIDWSNPITRGLVSCVDGSGVEIVTGSSLSVVGSVSSSVTSAGRAKSSAGSGCLSLSTRNLASPTNTAFSIVGTIYINNLSQTNNYISQTIETDGVFKQAAVIFGYVSGKIEYYASNYTGTNPRTGSQITISDTKPHTFCYSYNGSRWAGYLDGVKVFETTRTFSVNILSSNVNGYLLGSEVLADSLDGGCIQYSTFTRGLSDAEARSLTLNPWQIFKPIPRRIFAPVATAGGLYTLTAQSGSYSVSGQQATLLRHRNITASAGTYNITGQSVNITYSPTTAVYTLTAQVGSYSITGRSATLLKSKLLSASSGSYSITGNSATISKNRLLTALSGSYTITGHSTTLTYIPLTPVYTLTAQTGVYNITGHTAQLLRHRLLTTSSGSYEYIGQSITINKYTSGTSSLVKYVNVLTGEVLILKQLGV